MPVVEPADPTAAPDILVVDPPLQRRGSVVAVVEALLAEDVASSGIVVGVTWSP